MNLPKIIILEEFSPILRKVCKAVSFPLSKEDKILIDDMMLYLEMSQIEETCKKYDLRPGMGLAYPQIGISKRIFVIVNECEDGTFERHVVINPKIKSVSEEMVYVGEGEGCLSINRPTEGIVPRHARITIEAYDIDGKIYQIRVREEIAIAFQHEIDHLDGILFIDRIDKKNPFKGSDIYREI